MDIENPQSFKNRFLLETIKECSCYQCIRNFSVSEIEEWTDGELTALCPNCGIDTIIPGIVKDEVLIALNKRWFKRS